MLKLDDLYIQRWTISWNQEINQFFNKLIQLNPLVGKLSAIFVITAKCLLHTFSIVANTIEYSLRGFISLFLPGGKIKEYFSTLGSFLVINTVNVITVIPDIFIRTYFVLKDSKIDPSHTKHTLFFQIMNLLQ